MLLAWARPGKDKTFFFAFSGLGPSIKTPSSSLALASERFGVTHLRINNAND
jgi:hypothetical protein